MRHKIKYTKLQNDVEPSLYQMLSPFSDLLYCSFHAKCIRNSNIRRHRKYTTPVAKVIVRMNAAKIRYI